MTIPCAMKVSQHFLLGQIHNHQLIIWKDLTGSNRIVTILPTFTRWPRPPLPEWQATQWIPMVHRCAYLNWMFISVTYSQKPLLVISRHESWVMTRHFLEFFRYKTSHPNFMGYIYMYIWFYIYIIIYIYMLYTASILLIKSDPTKLARPALCPAIFEASHQMLLWSKQATDHHHLTWDSHGKPIMGINTVSPKKIEK